MKFKNAQIIANGKLVFKFAWLRAKRLKCIPMFAFSPLERSKILKVYITAQIANLSTRQKIEVDHVIPLSHPYVCGLHVANNLQVLSKTKNTNKSNNFTPYREVDGKKYYYTDLKTFFKPYKPRKSANPTKKNPTKLVKKRSKVVKTSVKRVKTVKKRLKTR